MAKSRQCVCLLQCLDESVKVFETASYVAWGIGYVRPYTKGT